ncbi:MAG TPA: hypothetical protein VGM33_18915 [Baekduia sp.]
MSSNQVASLRRLVLAAPLALAAVVALAGPAVAAPAPTTETYDAYANGHNTVNVDASFTPALDNLTYTDLGSPPAVFTSSGSAAFVEGDNVTSVPVAVDDGLTTTAAGADVTAATVKISNSFHSDQDVLSFTNDAATMGSITGSYDDTTGVLTLDSPGGESPSTWEHALHAVSYTNSALAPNTATRTIDFSLTNADGVTGDPASRTVTVTATDQTPVVTTTGGTVQSTHGPAGVAIDTGLTVTDRDSATVSLATVKLGAGAQPGDTLAFTGNPVLYGEISGDFVGDTLTLFPTGITAMGDWQAALRSVKLYSLPGAPGADRTIEFSVRDSTAKTSATVTRTVHISGPPQITTGSGSTAFVAGDNTASTPVAVDAGLTATDDTTLTSATVQITGGLQGGEDVLSFTNDNATMGDVTALYGGPGLVTLLSDGDADMSEWQNALRAVTYTDTAITPNTSTRTVSFTSTDTDGGDSATATRTVTVADTDQTPIVTTAGATTPYVAGQDEVVTVDGAVGVSDLDNPTLASATVTDRDLRAGDVLAFANDSSGGYGNITGSYAGGVLTLTSAGATATVAQWAAALSAVTFSTTVGAGSGHRTIAYKVNDGSADSAEQTSTVAVVVPPQITTDSGSAAFVAGDNVASTPVVVDSGLTVTADAAVQSATVQITGNFHAGEDVLAFTNDGATMGDITAGYTADTLTLTSAGAATLADWQHALRTIAYTDTAVTPDTAVRTITFTATDADGTDSLPAHRTVTVEATDQSPVVTTADTTAEVYADGPAAVVDDAVGVSDADDTTLTFATVQITAGFETGDILAFDDSGPGDYGNIASTWNDGSGLLRLTSAGGSATVAQFNNALRAVTFASTSSTYGVRTIAFSAGDGHESAVQVADHAHVLDPTPGLTTSSGPVAFAEAGTGAPTPVTVDSGVTIADPDSIAMRGATVTISGGLRDDQDVLAFTNDGATMSDLAGSYDASTGVLTLTSDNGATVAQWQAALRAVTYADTSVTPDTAARTVSFAVTDAEGHPSAVADRTVTVAATDQAPGVTTGPTALDYVAGADAAAIDAGVTVADVDSPALPGATVTITAGRHDGDTLAFANDDAGRYGDVSATYDAGAGTLSLASAGATATLAQWTHALAAVRFSAPKTAEAGDRTISFVVDDGTEDSAAATATVHVAAAPADPQPPREDPQPPRVDPQPPAADPQPTPAPPAPGPSCATATGSGSASGLPGCGTTVRDPRTHTSATAPSGAFAKPTTVSLTAVTRWRTGSTTPALKVATRSLVVHLQLHTQDDHRAITGVDAPLVLHLPAGRKRVPAFTADGKRWTVLPRLSSATLPAGKAYGYHLLRDGSIDVLTRRTGYFGLLAAAKPTGLRARLDGHVLDLRWRAGTDGATTSYLVIANGRRLAATTSTHVRIDLRAHGVASTKPIRLHVTAIAGSRRATGADTVTLVRGPGSPAAWRLGPAA